MDKLTRTLAVLFFVAGVNVGSAALINFDVDANGDAIVAPSGFDLTTSLTSLYSPLGVTFIPDPNSNGVGEILNDGGGFGVLAHSGDNFLAFNHPQFPAERITFDNLQSSISIYAAGGSGSSTFVLSAFDASDQLISTDTVSTQDWAQLQVSSNLGIKSVHISSTRSIFVLDDLSYEAAAIPEPSTYIVFTGLILCFGLAGWWRKRRQAA